ncbi:MBL fold metallo-hydrolase [Maricaulis sp.]|uniref:MBL fold metallo-hydrolase n=1 Tax=Maricaulis sp. TaxID=1486257 RepID=UPI00260BB2FA|nr:MBL fold metallo-hydrolase [Maricaulis sp.]
MSDIVRLTILGSGSSGGVPRANGDWGACNPANPKNRRRRCAALIEAARSAEDLAAGERVTRVAIDTSPDFREQMISARVPRLDGVVITHDHADQTHGLDDLRAFALLQRQRIPVWMDEPSAKSLTSRFGYAFQAPAGSPYPAILDARSMPEPGSAVKVDGPGGTVEIIPFDQEHGAIRSLGFKIGAIAYSADINALPDESAAILNQIGCWVVDALRHEPHGTHFSVSDALSALDAVSAQQGVLTNLHITLDYDALSAELPDHISSAYDGMTITETDSRITVSGAS